MAPRTPLQRILTISIRLKPYRMEPECARIGYGATLRSEAFKYLNMIVHHTPPPPTCIRPHKEPARRRVVAVRLHFYPDSESTYPKNWHQTLSAIRILRRRLCGLQRVFAIGQRERGFGSRAAFLQHVL